jgi:hypothetical protein
MAKNLAELLAVVERQTAEGRIAAPRPTAPVQPALAPPDDDTGLVRFDTQILARVDAAAKRVGINRVAWLQLAAEKFLEDRRDADSTLTEDTMRFIDRHVTPGEKRPPAPSVLREQDRVGLRKA